MDELTEDEITSLRASPRPWYRLPDSCMHNGYPLYLKLCTDVNDGKTTLIALLTDIRSSLWMEYFGEARAIHFRIKVSARETPKSTYADLKQEEAVTRLLQDLEQYTNTSDAEATTKSDSDAEMELVLQLDSLSFRLRLDKISQELQSRLLYDLVYLPLLGIVNAIQHEGEERLPSLQHAIDQESKRASGSADPEALSAMQRFSQGSAGVPVKKRIEISGLTAPPEVKAASPRPKTPKSSSKVSPSRAKTTRQEESEDEDADKTMLSSPAPEPKPLKPSSRAKSKTVSPSPFKHTRAATRASSSSPSPSPVLSAKSESKGKHRQIAESPDEGGNASEATEASDDAKGGMEADEAPSLRSKKSEKDEASSEETTASKASSKQASPAKARKSTPPIHADDRASTPISPQAPVLKRPAAGGRGLPPKRGKRPGMQWSNFG